MKKKKKVILCCDDRKAITKKFKERHEEHGPYIVRTANSTREWHERIREHGRLPDLVLLDIFFSKVPEDSPEEEAAQKALKQLDRRIDLTVKAAHAAWEKAGLETLKFLRDQYPPHKLKIAMYTRKGRYLLSDDELEMVDDHDAIWLPKKKQSAGAEEATIERIFGRLDGRYSRSYVGLGLFLCGFVSFLAGGIIGYVVAMTMDSTKMRAVAIYALTGVIVPVILTYVVGLLLRRVDARR